MWSLYVWPCVLVLVIVRGQLLNIDGNKLRFKCPPREINGQIRNIFLTRTTKTETTKTILVSWSTSKETSSKVELNDDRKPPDMLGATLNNVDCTDDGDYNCTVKIDSHGNRVDVLLFNGTFKHTVKENLAVSVSPKRDCYSTGDQITLNCTADTGTVENTIVWEAESPEGDFSPINRKFLKENKVSGKQSSCSPQSQFSVTFNLGEEDHSRIFQCRLSQSNRTKQWTLPRACTTTTTSTSTARVVYVPQHAQSTEDTQTTTNNNDIIGTAIGIGIVGIIVIVCIVVYMVNKKQKNSASKYSKRQSVNLRTNSLPGFPSYAGSITGSITGSDRYVARSLPDPPNPNYLTYLDSQGNVVTPPDPRADVVPPRDSADTNGVSVYVTMTSTTISELCPDTAQLDINASGAAAAGGGAGGGGGGQEEAEPLTEDQGLLDSDEEGPPLDDDGAPRMRTNRLYSNSEAATREESRTLDRVHTQSGTDNVHATFVKSMY